MSLKPLIKKLRKTFSNSNPHINITCDLKKKDNDPDWEGIVVSRYIMPVYLPNKRIKTQISIYPLGKDTYCLDNSDIQDYIIKHFNNGYQLHDDVTKTLSKLNTATNAKMVKLYGINKSTYQINQNVYQDNDIESYQKLIKQINIYFKFATQELSTAEILSYNSQYFSSSWQNKAIHFGKYFTGSQYDNMVDILRESAEISNGHKDSYTNYLDSLYSYKTKELYCKSREKSLDASYNSNFNKSFHSALSSVASYKNSFNSLLSQNPQASSYTSVMNSLSNRAELAEDDYWNASTSSSQSSASSLQDRLDDSQTSLEKSMLKSMNTSNASNSSSNDDDNNHE